MATDRPRETNSKHRPFRDSARGTSTSRTISLDRREFLQLTTAASVATILGCSREPEPAAAAGPESGPASASAPTAPTVNPVADQAAALGKDRERIFRFVQDEIRYEPYSGVLRGAKGTLAGRAGNSADQATLLAALLEASGVRFRFAVGPLGDAKIKELQAASVSDLATARERILKAMAADARSLGAIAAADSASSGQTGNPDKYAIDVSVIRETAARQFETAVGTIQAALAKSGIKVGSTWSDIPKLERERHVWIQAQSESKWIDLDPSFPGAAAGTAHGSAKESVDALPDDMRHRVEFNVLAETWTGGKFVETTIFEYGAFADSLVGVPVCFTHVKADDLKGLGLVGKSNGGTRYSPMLEVGARFFVSDTPISFGGAGGDEGASGGTLVDAFGSLGGSGLPDGETTAEWLEVRLSPPGGESRSAVRTIFDRVWEHRQDDGTADASAIAPVELFDLPTATREFLPCRTVHAFSIAVGATSLLSLAQPFESKELGPLVWPAHAYHLVRDAFMAEIALNRGVQTFLDSPGVVSVTIDSEAGGTTLETLSSCDIWHRSFGVLPVAGQQPDHPPLMIAGVLSHIAERCVSFDGYSRGGASADAAASVGSIFEQAKTQGVSSRVLRGSLPTGLPYPREALYLIDRYLQIGAVIVIPERVTDVQSRIGWWLIGPEAGETLDCMDDGRGSTMSEFVVNVKMVLKVTSCIVAISSTAISVGQIVAKKLTSVSATVDDVLTYASVVMGFVGIISGSGCVTSRFVPRPRPPPRPSPRPWPPPLKSKAEQRCC